MKKYFNDSLFAEMIHKQRLITKPSVSTREAARQIGISASTLSRLENRRFVPDIYTYYSVCAWLDKPMDYFFTTDGHN
jgi:transcriptional regulator with XRE-family HTH domain